MIRTFVIDSLRIIPDKLYLQLMHKKNLGKFINWNDPQLFSEKIQWLKLYDRNPLYTTFVDKILVKDYIRNVIGDEYIIPTMQVYDSVDQINFDELPDRFVLKTNHSGGSTGVVICTDKNNFNLEKAKKVLTSSMKFDSYAYGREWPYKNINKRIFLEKYMSDGNLDLKDYKFFCFNGEPRLCQVISGRSIDECIDFYDMSWNRINQLVGLNPRVHNSVSGHRMPSCFERMKEIAYKLSKDIPFVRIDLYDINGHCYFGEITFYPASGFGKFSPKEWNRIVGDWIILPTRKK